MIPQPAPKAPCQPRDASPARAGAGPRAAADDGHSAPSPASHALEPAARPGPPQRPTLPDAQAASGVELAADPRAARLGRMHARQVLAEWCLDELGDDIELVVSELVTNAVTATRPVAGPVRRDQPAAAHVTLTIRLLGWPDRDRGTRPRPEPARSRGRRGGLRPRARADDRGQAQRRMGTPARAVWREDRLLDHRRASLHTSAGP